MVPFNQIPSFGSILVIACFASNSWRKSSFLFYVQFTFNTSVWFEYLLDVLYIAGIVPAPQQTDDTRCAGIR